MVYFLEICGGKMRFFIVCLFFFCFLAPTWAKSQKARANLVIGDVEYQKKGKGKWRNLKVGSKIRHKDNVRTFAASRLEILFETGTRLHIEENSVISMKELLQNGANKSSKVKIGQGKILFNIKKLSGSLSKFEFETTTATAAIRGTAGGMGTDGNGVSVYLDEGIMEVRSKGSNRKFLIEEGDFAVQEGKNFVVKKLPEGVNKEKVLKEVIKSKKVIDSLLKNIPSSMMLKTDEVPGSLKTMDSTKILDSTIVKIISDSILSLETDNSVLQRLDSFTIADSLLAPGSYVIDTIPLDSLGNVIDTNIFIDSSAIKLDSLLPSVSSLADTSLSLDSLGNVVDSNLVIDSTAILADTSLSLDSLGNVVDSNLVIDSTANQLDSLLPADTALVLDSLGNIIDSNIVSDSTAIQPGSLLPADTSLSLDSSGNVTDSNAVLDSTVIEVDSLIPSPMLPIDTALSSDSLGNVMDASIPLDSSIIQTDSLLDVKGPSATDTTASADSGFLDSDNDMESLPTLDLKWSLPQAGSEVTVPFYLTGSASIGSRVLFNGKSIEVDASGYWKIIVEAMDEGIKEISIEVQNGDLTQSLSRSIDVSSKQIELSGTINSYSKIVNTTELDVSGTCIGGEKVTIGSFEANVVSSSWKTTLYWNEAESGSKYYAVECFADEKEVPLGEISFDYEILKTPLDLKLSTPSSFRISNGMFKIAGKYKGTNAELKLQLGSKEFNLSTPTGDFLFTAPISDKANSWGLSEASLVLSDGDGEISKTIDFEVDKTSKTVNTQGPLLSAIMDSFNGLVRLNVSSMKDDIAELTISTQDEELDVIEFENDLRNKTIKILAGVNSYSVKVTDQAGNSVERRFKDVGYWNRVEFSVELTSRLSSGKIKLPPLPPGSDDLMEEYFTIRIRNLPDDDFRFLERIVIENTAVSFRREFKQKQIDDVEYEIEIPLSLKKINQIKIRVEPKVGLPVETKKYFQFVR
jgi:hypothetical protein